MAKKTNNTNVEPTSKSEAIRQYAAKHPKATPAEISKALEGVTKADIYSALKRGSSSKVTMDQAKAAAKLLKSAGSEKEALKQIAAAGEAMDLLKVCKSVEKAEAAIAEAKTLSEVFG